jgi:hypothetical protein
LTSSKASLAAGSQALKGVKDLKLLRGQNQHLRKNQLNFKTYLASLPAISTIYWKHACQMNFFCG